VLQLPQINAEPAERADAARNRRLVLDAAARLFERDGPSCVTMEAVAAEAGVGKGTVFRRFGDRASLARAVISERETGLQEGMIRGPAPLGPGAPPLERLNAFGAAYLGFLEHHADLLLAAEGTSVTWLTSGVYAMYRTHIALLLREGGCGDSSDYLSDVLMAPLAAPVFKYHRQVRGLSLAELVAEYEGLVARVIDSSR
jgi:AcrR family transcriptional regulator